jgi:hypothetical protein
LLKLEKVGGGNFASVTWRSSSFSQLVLNLILRKSANPLLSSSISRLSIILLRLTAALTEHTCHISHMYQVLYSSDNGCHRIYIQQWEGGVTVKLVNQDRLTILKSAFSAIVKPTDHITIGDKNDSRKLLNNKFRTARH